MKQAKVIPLASGQLLVGFGDTLYMLDPRRRVLWTYAVSLILFDYAYTPATNLIYGTAGDNVMFILDAATGKVLHSNSRNGSAGYGAVLPFGTDHCLVMNNYWGYREKTKDIPDMEPMHDGIKAWRGTEALWHSDFPPDAERGGGGKRIFAVTKTKAGIYIKEVAVPKIKRR